MAHHELLGVNNALRAARGGRRTSDCQFNNVIPTSVMRKKVPSKDTHNDSLDSTFGDQMQVTPLGCKSAATFDPRLHSVLGIHLLNNKLSLSPKEATRQHIIVQNLENRQRNGCCATVGAGPSKTMAGEGQR
jgi:hypothetical protein